MNRFKFHALLFLGVCCLLIFVLFKSNCFFFKVRNDIKDIDYDNFSELVGFRPYQLLMVDVLRPNRMGTPGHVTYGAIVPEFSERVLMNGGWLRIDSLSSVSINPGAKFKSIAKFNHNFYTRTINKKPVVLICSPYGDDKYLGEIAYLVFVSTEYNTIF